MKGETIGEPLVGEGEVDSKVMVRRGKGNNQVGKEQKKAEIAKEAKEAKKAEEEDRVRVHDSMGDRDA